MKKYNDNFKLKKKLQNIFLSKSQIAGIKRVFSIK